MPNSPKTKIKPEDAVRSYLNFLSDPQSLVSDTEVAKAVKAVNEATDPIVKLKAIADFERLSNPDPKPLIEGFVNNAKTWADDIGIPVSAFQELKVPPEVLRKAGFEVEVSARKRPGTANPPTRAKAVPIETIKSHVVSELADKPFVLTDVISSAGGSNATVRKALEELIDAGKVVKLGPMQNYDGRGRAPLVYEVKQAA